ncbi:hypothetical protein HK102_004807, partial [Quaeritorhiza haematococci]
MSKPLVSKTSLSALNGSGVLGALGAAPGSVKASSVSSGGGGGMTNHNSKAAPALQTKVKGGDGATQKGGVASFATTSATSGAPPRKAKLRYSREMLLKLRESPLCDYKPEGLPSIESML